MFTRAGAGDRLVDRYFWSGHANPWSVWAFVAAYLTLVLAIYRRNRTLLTEVLPLVAINPLVAPEPADDSAWATRVVFGERIWLEQGTLRSTNTLFTAASAPVFLFMLKSAVERRSLRTGVGTVASIVLMLAFFRRMARLYETQTDR
ncbi:DUF6653 family protein [Natronococcus wangiae]|uniref:DUF6653 family protein n=1 Tax=Natronococcus wangiae TaxID=3068275 RepID=UPI00273E4F9A|nr:DUF6653 family protein [Natronococcus sp. AD5]